VILQPEVVLARADAATLSTPMAYLKGVWTTLANGFESSTGNKAVDQYMAIVLPGKMYRAEFLRRGLDSRNLSRALEDAGTLTSPLVPWNACGAYMASTIGVATVAYLRRRRRSSRRGDVGILYRELSRSPLSPPAGTANPL